MRCLRRGNGPRFGRRGPAGAAARVGGHGPAGAPLGGAHVCEGRACARACPSAWLWMIHKAQHTHADTLRKKRLNAERKLKTPRAPRPRATAVPPRPGLARVDDSAPPAAVPAGQGLLHPAVRGAAVQRAVRRRGGAVRRGGRAVQWHRGQPGPACCRGCAVGGGGFEPAYSTKGRLSSILGTARLGKGACCRMHMAVLGRRPAHEGGRPPNARGARRPGPAADAAPGRPPARPRPPPPPKPNPKRPARSPRRPCPSF